MSSLSFAAVRRRFGSILALDDVSMDVTDGEFFCVVGPTNAGKSTLLKVVAGIHAPERGTVAIDGRNMSGVAPKDRNVSLLFQNIALFPTMTGFQNIAFPLSASGAPGSEVAARVRAVADMLKISHLLDRQPRTYSGGEQQRVAIARAIAKKSDLLLLDEPLSNLDARIRIALRMEFKKLHRELAQTIIYVTHDQVEAMSLSDRIAVLHQGRFQQIGSPNEIYHRPANRFVAEFMGTPPMNIIEAELSGDFDTPELVGKDFRIAVPEMKSLESFSRLPKALSFGLRPEKIRTSSGQSPATPFPGEVRWIERLGAKNILDIGFGQANIKVVVPTDHSVRTEGPVWLGFTPLPQHILDRDTGKFFR
jgi:multiple sugar transport system ATP-binding protein